MHPGIPIMMVFVGCCSNVVFLELLVRDHPGSGNIITFSQFLFIALEGFIFTTRFGTKAAVIPLKNYILMVTMFFVVQITNNAAFNYNISVPLHTIVRAGSLMASLVLGIIILKRSYAWSKYASVMLITIGIIICSIASSGQVGSQPGSTGDEFVDNMNWLCGMGLLCFALFMSARMGIFQEQIFKEFGKHPSEALFYNHMLPLPGFLLVSRDILNHVLLYNASAPVTIPWLYVEVPKMWLFLLGSVITQYVCIRSVFILTTECSALTVTLVVTLRKFMSLVFSILYFKNIFTVYHWGGTVLVFGGTLAYTDVFSWRTRENS